MMPMSTCERNRLGWSMWAVGCVALVLLGAGLLLHGVGASAAAPVLLAAAPGPVVDDVVTAVDPGDPAGVAGLLVRALRQQSWSLAMAATFVLLVLLLRWSSGRLAAMLPGRLGWFFGWWTTDRGGAVLALLSGAGGALWVALAAGQRVSLELMIGGIGAGITAAGGWTVGKRLLRPRDQAAGPPIPVDDPSDG